VKGTFFPLTVLCLSATRLTKIQFSDIMCWFFLGVHNVFFGVGHITDTNSISSKPLLCEYISTNVPQPSLLFIYLFIFYTIIPPILPRHKLKVMYVNQIFNPFWIYFDSLQRTNEGLFTPIPLIT